jgi:multidrug efflux pump subunit AcrA (membrane-fusion protein)
MMRKYLSYILRLLIIVAVSATAFYYMKLAPITVSAVTVKRGPVEAEVLGAGTLIAHTRATISPKIQGRLVALMVDQNDVVTKDQLLARLDGSGRMPGSHLHISHSGVSPLCPRALCLAIQRS